MREHSERADVTRELDRAGGEHEPALVVPQLHGDAASVPQPSELLLGGDALATEGRQGALQHRHPSRMPLGDQQSQAIQEEIGGARGARRPGRATSGLGDLSQSGSGGQMAGEDRRGERFEVRLACEHDVERLEPLGGLEEQRRSVIAAARGEGDPGAQHVDPGALDLVERSPLGGGQQGKRGTRRARIVLGLRRGQRALRPARRIGRELGSPLQERGRCGDAAAALRAAGGALELGRDVLVGPGRRLGAMPGTAIGIDVRVGGLRQRLVHAAEVFRRRGPVDGRAHQRMPKPYAGAELEQAGRGRGRRVPDPDIETVGRPPHEHRLSRRLGRRDEQQLPRSRRKRRQPSPEAVLDPARERPRRRTVR